MENFPNKKIIERDTLLFPNHLKLAEILRQKFPGERNIHTLEWALKMSLAFLSYLTRVRKVNMEELQRPSCVRGYLVHSDQNTLSATIFLPLY